MKVLSRYLTEETEEKHEDQRNMWWLDIYIYLYTLMGGINGVRRWDELRFHDINTKFNKDWLRYWKLIEGDTQTDSMVIA
jgi:hypothetical protein